MKHKNQFFNVVLVIMFLLGPMSGLALAEGETTVEIVPAATQLAVGGETELQVRVNNVHALYGAELVLTFDPAIIEIIDANPGQDGVRCKPGTSSAPISRPSTR